MKALRKILATVLCLCLIFSCVSIAASADTKGTITIKDPTSSEATVAGKKFELYRIFYATTNGENTSYSWYPTNAAPTENPFYEFFAGITENGQPLVATGKQPAEYTNIQAVINHISNKYPTNFDLSGFAEDLHAYIVANDIDAIDEIVAGDVEKITFENLDYGYYLVYDATEFDTQTSAVRSAVMVDTVNSDIEITLKANRPELQKQVLENDDVTFGEATSSEIGEDVTFKITTYIPSHDYYDSYEYYIDDTLPTGLELNEDSIQVTIDSAAVNVDNFDDYCSVTEDTANDALKVEFTEYALIGDNKLATNTKIEIVYTAKVADDIPFGGVTNTAKLTYSNDPKIHTSFGSVEDSANVYTYMFVLTKYLIDSTGSVSATDRLGGAKFKIYSVDENGDKTLITFSEADNPKTDKIMYSVGGTIEELAVLDGTSPGKVTNSTYFGGNLGDITIFGLKEGKYYIEETVAPAGYVLPNDGFEITISDTIDANGNISILNTTVGEHKSSGAIGNFGGEASNYLTWLDIGNTAGSELPSTGGIGTTLFTVFGVILMAGALAFFTLRKRNSAV